MTESIAKDRQFEWGVASRPHEGQVRSGDLHLVTDTPQGFLAAVVDGLGHGDEATAAAEAAIGVLRKDPGDPVPVLIQRCHRALASTRGAVMTVASFDAAERTVSVVGIGNVEAVLLRARPNGERAAEHVLLRAGVVGYQLPVARASVLAVRPGDTLILTTDGIREDFAARVNVAEALASMTKRILKEHLRGKDDALVLAIRFLKEAP